MNHVWNFQKYPGIMLLALLSAVFGGVSQPGTAGLFLVVLGIWLGLGSLSAQPPRAVFFLWGSWLWGTLALYPGRGSTADVNALFLYQPRISLESLVLFLAGLAFFTWCLGNPVGEQVRLKTLRLFGGVS